MKPEDKGPCVDVIIAAWNRGATIERAMLSALAEPEVHRVIVVDDGSTDDTAVRAERVALSWKPRVIVRRLRTNRGPSAARNTGLELSRSPWVASLDGDDFFRPGRMAKLLLQADAYDFVADDLDQVLQGQNMQVDTLLPSLLEIGRQKSSAPWQLDLEGFALGNIGEVGHLGYLKPIMRRSFLDRHSLRYDERLRLGEDYCLYARALALRGRFLVIPQRGYVSVNRPDSLSRRHWKVDLERLRDADLEIAAMSGITPSEHRAIRKHYETVDARAQWEAVIDAIKARSVSRFVGPFFRSLTVSSFLIGNLLTQLRVRSGKRLTSLTKRGRGSMKEASP